MSAAQRPPSRLQGYLPMLGGQSAALAAGFLVSVVLVKAIGADGRGVVALLTTATIVAASVASGGLEGAMAREAGSGGRSAARMALWWSATAGLAFALAWGLAAAGLAGFFRLGALDAGALAAGGMLLVFSTSLLRGVLLGLGRFREIGAGRALSAVAGLVAVTVLAIAGVLTAGLAVAAAFAAVVPQGAAYWRAAGRPAGVRMEAAARRRHVAYAVRSSLGTLFLAIQSRYDLLIVGAFLTAADTGVYAVLLSLSELAWVPIDVAALMVLGSAAGARHSLADTARASRAVLVLAVLIALGIVALGPVVLGVVFGSAFLDEYPTLLLLLPGSVALAVWRFVMNDAAGRGHPEIRSMSAGAGGLVALAAGLAAVPLFGLPGAAGASSLAYATTAAIGLRRYCRHYGVAPRELLRPRRGDLARRPRAVS